MDLSYERPGEHNYIRSLDRNGIRVGEDFFMDSLIISADQLITDWPPRCVGELNDELLGPLFDLGPEVLLFGTGNRQVFLEPRMMVSFYQKEIGIEVMTTDAACRTFNVLVSEGRNVVAALFPAVIP